MKSIVLLALVVACALVFAEAADTSSPSTKPIKEIKDIKEIKEIKEIKDTATSSKEVKLAKEAAKKKKDCARDCTTITYDPICAHDPNDATFKPRTFGTECALNVYNCEMGTKLMVKNKGECPGSGGVRLS